MATKKASGTKTPAKKVTKKAADTNGAKKSTGTTRVKDKLDGLTEARRRNIAKLIFRERSKSPSTSWPEITTKIEEKYDWTLPGSMTGRRLLREYGPENAEEAIIQQTRTKKDDGTVTTKKKKASAKKAKVVEEELEDEEEDTDDEELEEEYEEELEADDDDDDDEDDEDDEDEEEEPPAKAKKVRVTRGRGKKANPSK